MNTLNLTILQEKLSQVIDNVLQTGIPVEIERNGRKVMIIEVKSQQSVTERLKIHPLFTDNINFDTPTEWEWNETKNL
ncbi:type II toxin-antitoxin system Phd/YefM family antitoxin [Candidatus Halobeggiatoa sp. HSG11]|nr:type II toxin-antitoxin system Phd/YefM family antitoxin [Candidatus Halobeggiatoa sp. HSG11]